jgi:hypothetical protein
MRTALEGLRQMLVQDDAGCGLSHLAHGIGLEHLEAVAIGFRFEGGHHLIEHDNARRLSLDALLRSCAPRGRFWAGARQQEWCLRAHDHRLRARKGADSRQATVQKWVAALAKEGVEFTPETDEAGSRVRWKRGWPKVKR